MNLSGSVAPFHPHLYSAISSARGFLLTIVAVLFCVAPAQGQLLQYDGFAYSVGTNLAGNGTWSALNTGTAPIIASGNLDRKSVV